MGHTTPTEMEHALSQPSESLSAPVWQDLLGGAHGPKRRLAKQELTALLERQQGFGIEGRSPSGHAEKRRDER